MALSPPPGDPRPARKQARFDEILAAAWGIADEEGLAGVSLHEVARRVGLRQPSLYAYIESKAALYDAMFAQAAQSVVSHMKARSYAPEPRRAVSEACRAMYEFTSKNPAASQLLFDRTIPGFEPSPASYAFAVDFQTLMVDKFVAAGIVDPGDVDIFTSLVAGLAMQQQTNEPGGNRWTRHLDTVLDMFFTYIDGKGANSSPPEQTATTARANHRRPPAGAGRSRRASTPTAPSPPTGGAR